MQGLRVALIGKLGEDTELPSARHRLGPIGDIELAVDTGSVGLDGARGHNELSCDLLVGLAQGHEVENFQLALDDFIVSLTIGESEKGAIAEGGVAVSRAVAVPLPSI